MKLALVIDRKCSSALPLKDGSLLYNINVNRQGEKWSLWGVISEMADIKLFKTFGSGYGKFLITKMLLYICCLCVHSRCEIMWRYAEYGSVYSVCTVSSSYLSTQILPETLLGEHQ